MTYSNKNLSGGFHLVRNYGSTRAPLGKVRAGQDAQKKPVASPRISTFRNKRGREPSLYLKTKALTLWLTVSLGQT